MRFGVVIFPGSNCEQDVIRATRYLGYESEYIWHGDTDLSGFDAIVLPGGFSYGDYIRCGAVARFSPVMAEVVRFAEAGGPVLGICNGFQILTEAHLLPGALLRNRGLKFICKPVTLRVEESVCQWVDLPAGMLRTIPINHNEGNYVCDAETLSALAANGQIVLRYVEQDGSTSPGGSAPNGALDDIAGICNERGNVFGLMPHPERVVDPLVGGTDGQPFFTSIVGRLAEVAS
jgi:phosphoribosylformylglycinamidine synthase